MRIYAGISVLFLLSALLAGCGKPDYDAPSQRERIERYLTSNNMEYVELGGAYRYTYHSTEGNTPAERGDSLYIYYSGHLFSSGAGAMYTTNILSDAEAAGIDRTFINFSPKGFRLGDGTVLRGVDYGLQGSLEGDSLMLFLAYDLAYGEKGVGIVAPGSAVMMKIVVDKVVK